MTTYLDYRKTLEPRLGEELTVYPQGIKPIKGILSKGPMFYSVRGDTGMLILMPGSLATLKFEDITYDLRDMK
jgi:hypothetical protein